MRRIVHHELGEPARVVRVEDLPSEPLGPDQVRIRVSYAPMHPGDVLGVMGSPAFGTPPAIGAAGRVPGLEGAGVVSEVGAQIDPNLGLRPGLRVAFFPAPGSWRDEVAVPAGSVARLPDSIPDEVAAQVLINTASALTAIRAAHDSLPPDARTGVVVLVTAAGSAVGRLVCKFLTNRGVKVIGLVRSESGAAKLARVVPGSTIFATDVAGWKDRARTAAGEAKIHTAIDSVGGRLLGDIGELLAEGTGTVINYGSLGGETSDIRIFPPRCLTLKGVVLGQWLQQPPEQRKADFALALQLAHEPWPLFEVAGQYSPSRIADAVAHIGQPGRAGVVLFAFTRD
ncbi:NADPH:quinone reductase [Rhizobiales bacterium GAS191]|nr:NADPH:quinone reductase [Rhizobiales bacterium GAS191]